jgi:hypothetical protein
VPQAFRLSTDLGPQIAQGACVLLECYDEAPADVPKVSEGGLRGLMLAAAQLEVALVGLPVEPDL